MSDYVDLETVDFLSIEIELRSKLNELTNNQLTELINANISNIDNELIESICIFFKSRNFLSIKQRKCLIYYLLNSKLDLFNLL